MGEPSGHSALRMVLWAVSFVLVTVAVLVLAGCGSFRLKLSKGAEAGSIELAATEAMGEDSVVGSVTVEEGQCLLISPQLEQGTIHVSLSLDDGDASGGLISSLEADVTGTEETAHAIDPGSYTLRAAGVSADPATGTCSVRVLGVAELAEVDAKLAEQVELEEGRAAAGSFSTIEESGVLRIGTTGDVAPLCTLDEDGTYEGFDVELAADLAEFLGVKVKWVTTTWEALADDALAGRFDIALGGVVACKEYRDELLVSDGYLETGIGILVRPGDAWTYSAVEDLNDPEVRVAACPGTTGAHFAQEHLPSCELVLCKSNAEAAELVATGEADAMVATTLEVTRYAWADYRLSTPLGSEGLAETEVVVLVAPGVDSKRLLQNVNSFIGQERLLGRLEQLEEIYVDGNEGAALLGVAE